VTNDIGQCQQDFEAIVREREQNGLIVTDNKSKCCLKSRMSRDPSLECGFRARFLILDTILLKDSVFLKRLLIDDERKDGWMENRNDTGINPIAPV
jgi:hypothetical protein